MAEVAQRGGKCPIPGNTKSQAEWGSEQPDPVEDVPAHCRGDYSMNLNCTELTWHTNPTQVCN